MAGASDAQLWGYDFNGADEQKKWQEMQQLVNWNIGEELTTEEEAGGIGDTGGGQVLVSVEESKSSQLSAITTNGPAATEASSSNERARGNKDRMYRDRMRSSLQEARTLLKVRGIDCGVKECELLRAWLKYTKYVYPSCRWGVEIQEN